MSLRRHGVACLSILGLLTACRLDDVGNGEVTHPTPSNTPPPDAAVLTDNSEPTGLKGERLISWRVARDRLRGARTVAKIGSNAEGPELFGEIQDARVDERGRLWVLDGQASAVRIFAGDGTYLDGFGRVGDGPLEMRNTRGMLLLGANRVVVFTARRQAKVFDRDPAGWRLAESVGFPVTIEDNCSYPARQFLHGVVGRADQSLIYGMRELGDTAIARYGIGYKSDVKQFNDVLSMGQIACVPTQNLVVFAFQLFPMVSAYSVDTADLVWSAYVDAYIQQRIETSDVSMRNYYGLPHDYLATALTMPSGHVVLQYRRYGDQFDLHAVRTFLLDAETGQGSLVADDMPEIESFHAGGYVASFEDPYPSIELRAFEGP